MTRKEYVADLERDLTALEFQKERLELQLKTQLEEINEAIARKRLTLKVWQPK